MHLSLEHDPQDGVANSERHGTRHVVLTLIWDKSAQMSLECYHTCWLSQELS